MAITLAAALAIPFSNFFTIFSANSLSALDIASLETFFLAHLRTFSSCFNTLLSLKNLSSNLVIFDTTSEAFPESLPALSLTFPATSPAFSAAFPILPPLFLTALNAFFIPDVAFFISLESIVVAFPAASKALFPTLPAISSTLSATTFLAFCQVFPITPLASSTLFNLFNFLDSNASLKASCALFIFWPVLYRTFWPAKLAACLALHPAFLASEKSSTILRPPSINLIGVDAIWADIFVSFPVTLASLPTLLKTGICLVSLAALEPKLLANFPTPVTILVPLTRVFFPYFPPVASILTPAQFPGLVSTAERTYLEFSSLSSSVRDISAPITWEAKSGYINKSAPVNWTTFPSDPVTSAITVSLSLHNWATVTPLSKTGVFHNCLSAGNAFFWTDGQALWYANDCSISFSDPSPALSLVYSTIFAVPDAAEPLVEVVVCVETLDVWVVLLCVLAAILDVFVVVDTVPLEEPFKGPLYLSNIDWSLAAVLPSSTLAEDPLPVELDVFAAPVVPVVKVTFPPSISLEDGFSLSFLSLSLKNPPITGKWDKASLNRDTTPDAIPENTVPNNLGAFSTTVLTPNDIRSGNLSAIRSIPSPMSGSTVFLVKSLTWYHTPEVLPVPSGPNHTSVTLSFIASPMVVSVIIGLPFSSYILLPCASFCWTWIFFWDILLSNPTPAIPPTPANTGNAYLATFPIILEKNPSSSSSSSLPNPNNPFNPSPRLDILDNIPFCVCLCSSLIAKVSLVSESLSSGISLPWLSVLIRIGPASVMTVLDLLDFLLILLTRFLAAPLNWEALDIAPLANLCANEKSPALAAATTSEILIWAANSSSVIFLFCFVTVNLFFIVSTPLTFAFVNSVEPSLTTAGAWNSSSSSYSSLAIDSASCLALLAAFLWALSFLL